MEKLPESFYDCHIERSGAGFMRMNIGCTHGTVREAVRRLQLATEELQ